MLGRTTLYLYGSAGPARALREIQKSKLYRVQLQYATFEEYCEERWGWTRDYGYQLLRASQVAENVELTIQNPTTEKLPGFTQALELARLGPERGVRLPDGTFPEQLTEHHCLGERPVYT